MLRKEPWPGPKLWPEVVPLTMRGLTFVTKSFSREKVLVTVKPQPASNDRRIMGPEVVGGADAKPKGFGKRIPQMSTETSTRSIGV